MATSVRLPSWPSKEIAIPVNARLYVKKDQCNAWGIAFQTRNELALEMLQLLREWLPEREFLLEADGGYAAKA